MQDGIYAKFNTSKGEIVVKLTHDKTPGTVGNFVALAEGKQENTAKAAGEPYYNGLKFHRVIPDFMIQGGCPLGTGTGDAGYKFDDEFHPELTHSGPGILSMANAGPGTNGSQFFITHIATPWLDNKHTVFGHLESGQDIVDTIAQGESGLRYKIIQKGDGAKAAAGNQVSVHYEGSLLSGQVFDSSYKRNEPIDFQLGVGQVIPGSGGVIPQYATLIFDVELMGTK